MKTGNGPSEQKSDVPAGLFRQFYPRTQLIVELYACGKKIEILLGCMITPRYHELQKRYYQLRTTMDNMRSNEQAIKQILLTSLLELLLLFLNRNTVGFYMILQISQSK